MRCFRITLTGLTAAALSLGCGESTTPSQTPRPPVDGPRTTAAVGFTSTTLARGNAGIFDVFSQADGYNARLRSTSNSDVLVSNVVVVPGGTSGWHSHPGPVVIIVKTGTLTFYHTDFHGGCTTRVYQAGGVYFEKGGEIGTLKNEGSVEGTLTVTFFLPAGAAARIDQPAIVGAHCPP